MGGEKFAVVAVNVDTGNRERARRFLDEIKVARLPWYADPSLKVFNEMKGRGLALGLPTTVLIDVEVYDGNGQRVFQRFYDNQSLRAGVAFYLTPSWTPSRAGTYTVKIGVFKPGWNGTLAWNPQAATIVVR